MTEGQSPYESFARDSPIPVWIQGVETVEFANRAAAEFLGVEGPEDLVGRSALEFVPPEERDQAREHNRYIVEAGQPLTTMEGAVHAADGRTRYGRYVGMPVEYGGEDAILVVAHDVTRRREYERTLERQTRRLEELADVLSHDLRNPLEVANAELALARAECDSAHLDGVETALSRIEDLVEGTLAMAKSGQRIDADGLGTVSLADVARRCWETVATDGARLDVRGDLDFEGDEPRLRRVFENLYRNALEHAGGSARVQVGPLPGRDGFYVQDDGDGIAPGDRDRVFESGYSTDGSGSGLGLNIVEAIVTAHGWTIDVGESPAGGARFEVSGVAAVG